MPRATKKAKLEPATIAERVVAEHMEPATIGGRVHAHEEKPEEPLFQHRGAETESGYASAGSKGRNKASAASAIGVSAKSVNESPAGSSPGTTLRGRAAKSRVAGRKRKAGKAESEEEEVKPSETTETAAATTEGRTDEGIAAEAEPAASVEASQAAPEKGPEVESVLPSSIEEFAYNMKTLPVEKTVWAFRNFLAASRYHVPADNVVVLQLDSFLVEPDVLVETLLDPFLVYVKDAASDAITPWATWFRFDEATTHTLPDGMEERVIPARAGPGVDSLRLAGVKSDTLQDVIDRSHDPLALPPLLPEVFQAHVETFRKSWAGTQGLRDADAGN
jgi:hypothetical protein